VSAPPWGGVDRDTAEALERLATLSWRYERDSDANDFLNACREDHEEHGSVSVNRVRARLTVNGRLSIPARRFSALWSIHTGKDRPMVKTGKWEICQGSTSRNNGRPYPLRRWVAGDQS
jgi:hypothetical protein